MKTALTEKGAIHLTRQGTFLAKTMKKGEKAMCILTIKQNYSRIELQFKNIVDAAIMVDTMKPYVADETEFSIEETAEAAKEGQGEE